MPPALRLGVALKGAILWVLVSCVLGLVPLLVVPNHATASIPWVAAAFGVIGAAAHALVVALKRQPFHLRTSVLAVTCLSCSGFLAVAYWVSGTPSEPLQELVRILTYTALPAIAVSYSVLRILRWHGAAYPLAQPPTRYGRRCKPGPRQS